MQVNWAKLDGITTYASKGTHLMNRLFLDHPHSVDESYGEHALFASRFSLRLFGAAFAALIHAVLPFAFEKTASRIVADLYTKTHNRGS